MVRWVVFDLGGVLFRIHHGWREAAESNGLVRPDLDFGIFSSPEFSGYQNGDMTDAEYLPMLATAMQVSASQALTLHQAILKEPYRGSLELILELKERGFKTACLSNTNSLHWDKLMNFSYFPAMEHLDLRLASFEVKMSKPSESIFRKFEEQSGGEPHEIVFFDDLNENVEAAQQCGWRAHLVGREAPIDQMRMHLQEHREF